MKIVKAGGKRRLVLTVGDLPVKVAGIVEAPPAMVKEIIGWCTAYRKALELQHVRRTEQETILRLEWQIGNSLDAGEKSRLEKMVESRLQKIRKMVDEIASVTGYPDDPRIGGNYEEHFARYAKEHTFALDLSGWKYADIVEKMKKDNPSRVKKAKSDYIVVNLLITDFGDRRASWFNDGKRLRVDITDTSEISHIAIMVEHELRHMAQCFLSAVVGSSAGLPSDRMRTPYIKQHYAYPYSNYDEDRKKAVMDFKEMEGGDISKGDFHALDDIEFYTDLGQAVSNFREVMRRNNAGRLSDFQFNYLIKKFVGLEPVRDGDVDGQHAVFKSLKKHRPKYIKAVNEFMKAARVIREELKEKASRPLSAGSRRRLVIMASELNAGEE